MDSAVTKRSLSLNGHKTSVSLEADFWEGLKEIADHRGMKIGELVSDFDKEHAPQNLSSALRVFVVRYYKFGRVV